MKKAITLLSGGLDSFVSTAIARKRHKIILGLTFDYGQRAAKREIVSAKKICRLWNIPHKVLALPWLAEITKTALVNSRTSIPVFNEPTNQPACRQARRTNERTAAAVWVPNRNGLFINIAASFSESLKADVIIAGFNKEEAVTFPDNSGEFVSRINSSLKYSTLNKTKVISYTQNMTKTDMVRYATKNGLSLKHCWPCYRGGKKLCGKCESCVRFMRAYENIIS